MAGEGNCNPKMVLDHTERITHLETIQRIHAQSITSLTNMGKEFMHMKYALYGALGLYMLQAIGLTEFLKKVLL